MSAYKGADISVNPCIQSDKVIDWAAARLHSKTPFEPKIRHIPDGAALVLRGAIDIYCHRSGRKHHYLSAVSRQHGRRLLVYDDRGGWFASLIAAPTARPAMAAPATPQPQSPPRPLPLQPPPPRPPSPRAYTLSKPGNAIDTADTTIIINFIYFMAGLLPPFFHPRYHLAALPNVESDCETRFSSRSKRFWIRKYPRSQPR